MTRGSAFALGFLALATLAVPDGARGRDSSSYQLQTLHAFVGGSGDGADPGSALVADGAGNYYGTTSAGGSSNLGTVFRLAPDGSVTTIHEFHGGRGGEWPVGPLLMASDGSVLGSVDVRDANYIILGSVLYSLSPRGREHVLHRFRQDDPAGFGLESGLTRGPDGSLYGASDFGGAHGCGTVFHLTVAGSIEVLYVFSGRADGCTPLSAPVFDAAGNLYGTTRMGGAANAGLVYKLGSDRTYTILYEFNPYRGDGSSPSGPLVLDANGFLTGTTLGGGHDDFGTVYRIAPNGTERVLHAFSGPKDGCSPAGGVISDGGNLYGTTAGCGTNQVGTVFKIGRGGVESILYAFDVTDGSWPEAGLVLDAQGSLLGTTMLGGAGHDGTLFRLNPNE
jgi:uncharacterized repeat protein (TIGR03803 family)